jgi:hypothetical protein
MSDQPKTISSARLNLWIFGLTWALGDALLLVGMHLAVKQNPHVLGGYLLLLGAVQAACGWAYLGVRDQERGAAWSRERERQFTEG